MKNNLENISQSSLEERLIEFACRILDLAESIPVTPTGKHLSGQILRSGTSPALNYGEARAAESRNDFLHKLKICLKELRETYICLRLIEKRKWFSENKLDTLIKENNELVAIFVTSTKTLANKQ